MNPMRGITQSTDATGRKRYRVRVRGYNPGGDQPAQEFNARFTDLAAAMKYRDEALAALDGDAPAPAAPARTITATARSITVEDAARRLCKGMKDGSIRTRTGTIYKPGCVRGYEESLRVLVLPKIGSCPISTLTTGDVQRFVDGVASEKSPEHARQALLALRVALKVALRYGELESNPCAGVTLPMNPNGEKPARVITPAEAAAIVAQAEKDDARLKRSLVAPIIALAFGTGLRLGELLALEWGSEGLDLDAGVVHVRRALDRIRDDAGQYVFIAPKSRSSHRDVPLAPEDVVRLKRHRLATGRRDGELVFAGTLGEPLSQLPAARGFKRAAERAGIVEPLPHFHDTRHAYATHMLAAGLGAHAVARLLGHSTAALVLARYGHALPDELASAGETLSAWRAAR